MRADKTGSAGDEQLFHLKSPAAVEFLESTGMVHASIA